MTAEIQVVLEHDRALILHGDSTQLGEVLEPESIDSMITDPPSGISFMSKGWDSDKGGRDKWIAWLTELMMPSFRALKPGAHGLVWALPRTSHWTVTALENCGFEIRDIVMHVFGTGFPKNLDVSKAIDEALGAEREVVGVQLAPGALMQAMSMGGNGEEAGSAWSGQKLGGPVTDDAKRWDGFGTALKPAAEHWILVRKPLVNSVARNVMSFGTGAINIDGCRIGEGELGRWPAQFALSHLDGCIAEGERVDTHSVGVGEKLGSSSRNLEFGMGKRAVETVETVETVYRCAPGCPVLELEQQCEGASRFYFTAKPTGSEKNAGLAHLESKTPGQMTSRVDGSAGLSSPRAGGGRTGGGKNSHPTPKPLSLMRWLVRMITPPGGVVLDPFAGSGTTGVAALDEGFSFVGCELGGDDGSYVPILVGRIRHALALDGDTE